MKRLSKSINTLLLGTAIALGGCVADKPVKEPAIDKRTIDGIDYRLIEDTRTKNPDDFILYANVDGHEFDFPSIPRKYFGENFPIVMVGGQDVYITEKGQVYTVKVEKE